MVVDLLQSPPEDVGRTLVLLVGISKNPNYPSLNAPSNDAAALAKALIDKKGCGLHDGDVLLLPEAEATCNRIISEIGALASRASEADRIFIYFAGHGEPLQDDFGLVGWDSKPGDPPEPLTRGSEIGQALSGTRAYGVLVVIDCCYGANFTEFPPGFFKTRGASSYRVLLSSTRANERSWEIARGGSTLFSTYLRKCIDGSVPVGFVPGAIFLSDLAKYIANHVTDDLKAIDESYRQEQTFFGAYGHDPLLFRQARLTENRILLLLARYSLRDLGRFAAVAFSCLVAAVSAIVMLHYTLLERSEYAMTANDWIDIETGRAGLNAYRFPKLFWQTDLLREDASEDSALRKEGGTINAPIEAPALPTLTQQLLPGARLRVMYWGGSVENARQGLKDLWKMDKSLTGAAFLLSKLTRAEDLSWLAEVAAQTPSEIVKAFAWVAAARIDPNSPASGLHQSKREPYTLPMELLSVVPGPCADAEREYIVGLLGKVPSEDYRASALNGALRLGCAIPVDALAETLIYSFGLFAVEDVAGYIESNQPSGDELLTMLPAFAQADPDKSDLPLKAMAVISMIPRAPCIPGLRKQLHAANPDVRAMAANALLAHCDADIVNEIRSSGPLAPELISVLAAYGHSSPDEVRTRLADENLETFDASYLLIALGAMGSRDDIATIKKFVERRPDTEEGVRIAAVLALHELKAPASEATPFLSGIFESSKFALDWVIDVEPKAAVRLRREAMGNGNGASYVRFGARLPLAPEDIAFLESQLDTVGRGAAAGILAQVQPPEGVIKLLSSPIREIRSEAADWAPVNSHVSETILDQLHTPVPSKELEQLREDLSLRKLIFSLLSNAPEVTRPWRAKLLTETWRPQFRRGLLELLDAQERWSHLGNFWAIRGNSP
jgi:HEAT repeat protein